MAKNIKKMNREMMSKDERRLRAKEKRRKKKERKIQDKKKSGRSKPQTAQQTIPYLRMFKDGICQVTKDYYTKTVQFYDINYQLALNEDKTTIFENYCDFLNYFDPELFTEQYLN